MVRSEGVEVLERHLDNLVQQIAEKYRLLQEVDDMVAFKASKLSIHWPQNNLQQLSYFSYIKKKRWKFWSRSKSFQEWKSKYGLSLYVYDLSNGMAKALSRQFLGEHFDGIWHTSVVVYGSEYYYGQGIFKSKPGMTSHGNPVEKIAMGSTEIPIQLFEEFLDNIRSLFTNHVVEFLLGKSIPSHITSLPANFLKTPMGQAMRPMLENIFGPSSLSVTNSHPQHDVRHVPTSQVKHVTRLEEWQNILSKSKALIVKFTSATCGPCHIIAPHFERLLKERALKGHLVEGVSVEVGSSPQIASNYNITAMPTFISFANGEKVEEFKGANVDSLAKMFDTLAYIAYPAHKHRKLTLTTYTKLPNVPILYQTLPPLDKVVGKLKSFLSSNDDSKFNSIVSSLKQNQCPRKNDLQYLVDLYRSLSKDTLFPLMDLFRVISMHADGILFFESYSDLREIIAKSEPTNVVLLKWLCNLFNSSRLFPYTFELREYIVNCVVQGLLSETENVRVAASSLLYNCALRVRDSRVACEYDEEKELEMLSAASEALSIEKENETSFRIVAAISHLLYMGPEHVIDLGRVLDFEKIVSNQIDARCKDLSKDIKAMLLE